jgi:hypothetical protein
MRPTDHGSLQLAGLDSAAARSEKAAPVPGLVVVARNRPEPKADLVIA